MAATRSKFRTLQEESFYIEENEEVESASSSGNGKFIAVIALGVLVAVSLATVLSIAS
jgi:hypothetical protein